MKENKSGIYKITSPSGKVYVGQSIDLYRRIDAYKRMSNVKNQPKLYNSFKKYGANNHVFEIIETCNYSIISDRERYWQEYYDVLGKNGLNCIYANCNNSSYVFSDDVKKKMSDSKKGIKFTETHKNRISKSLKGKRKTESHKNNLSKSNKNRRTGDRHHNSKLVLDFSTGIFFYSAKEAALSIGIKHSTMKSRLNNKKTIIGSLRYV